MTCCFALSLEEICQTYFIMHDIVQEMVKLPKKKAATSILLTIGQVE